MTRHCFVLVTFAIMIPLIRADDPPEGWEELKTANGRARTFVPKGQLKETINGTPTTGGIKAKIEVTYSASEALGMYGMAHAEYSKDAAKDSKKALTHMRSFLLKIQDARVVSEKRITYSDKKYPGIEYLAESMFQGQRRAIAARMYLIDGHGVALYTTAPPNANPAKEIEQFFKSFQWQPDSDDKAKPAPEKK